MPTKDEHLTKAIRNHQFGEAMKPISPTVTGWAMTVLFYSALHYVSAYNAKYFKKFDNHREMLRDMQNNDVLLPIYDDYKDLFAYSWNARYHTAVYGPTELNEVKEILGAVRKHITDLL